MKKLNLILAALILAAVFAGAAFADEAVTVNPIKSVIADQIGQAVGLALATIISWAAYAGARFFNKGADAAKLEEIREHTKMWVMAAEEKFALKKKIGNVIANAGEAKFGEVKKAFAQKYPGLPIESVERFILAAVAEKKGLGVTKDLGS